MRRAAIPCVAAPAERGGGIRITGAGVATRLWILIMGNKLVLFIPSYVLKSEEV